MEIGIYLVIKNCAQETKRAKWEIDVNEMKLSNVSVFLILEIVNDSLWQDEYWNV